jgi:hypothetical protein
LHLASSFECGLLFLFIVHGQIVSCPMGAMMSIHAFFPSIVEAPFDARSFTIDT